MIWVVLLLILAVVLLGASAIVGAPGIITGFIAAAGALAVGSFTFQLEPGTVMILGILGFFVIVALIVAITAVTRS